MFLMLWQIGGYQIIEMAFVAHRRQIPPARKPRSVFGILMLRDCLPAIAADFHSVALNPHRAAHNHLDDPLPMTDKHALCINKPAWRRNILFVAPDVHPGLLKV